MKQFHKDIIYEYDSLSKESRDELDLHIENDPEMKSLLEDMNGLEELMQDNLPELSSSFCDDLMEKVEEETPVNETRSTAKWMTILIAAQVAIICLLPSIDLPAIWHSASNFIGSITPSSSDYTHSLWSSAKEYLGNNNLILISYWGLCVATVIASLYLFKIVNKKDNHHV